MIVYMTPSSQFRSEDLAYAAGIIDGEGSIGIYTRRIRRTYALCIRVEMREIQAIELLHSMFGGHRSLKAVARQNRDRHSPLHTWFVAAKMASNCARQLLPYLRIKRAQAENLIAVHTIHEQIRASTTLQRSQRTGPMHAYGRYYVDPALLEKCHDLYLQQKALNHRGKVAA